MPRKVSMQLTEEELDAAIWTAEQQMGWAISEGYELGHSNEDPVKRLNIGVMGQKTEIATGRYLDLFWAPRIRETHRPDLGDDNLPVEVRSCASVNDPYMGLWAKDLDKWDRFQRGLEGGKKDCPWVCVQTVVIHRAPWVHIQGWMLMSELAPLIQPTDRKGWWKVPATKLHDIRELKEEVASWDKRHRFMPIPDVMERYHLGQMETADD
jgi:hypothetical protein